MDHQVNAGGIEGKTAACLQQAAVDQFRAEQTNLFADGDNHFQRGMRQLTFADDLERFDDFGDPRLVVGAEHGIAGAGENTVTQDRPDAQCRLDGIHMGGKEQRLAAVSGSRETGNQIAAVTAGFCRGVIEADLAHPVRGNVDEITGNFSFPRRDWRWRQAGRTHR